MASLFERLKEKQSQQLEKEQPDEPELIRRGPQPIIPLAHSRSLPSEKLLSWMINYWALTHHHRAGYRRLWPLLCPRSNEQDKPDQNAG